MRGAESRSSSILSLSDLSSFFLRHATAVELLLDEDEDELPEAVADHD